MAYTMGSLFDGSGGFPLASSLCGIEPKWASEIEPYPIAVTRSRFPNMLHLGDISKVNGAKIEPVDIVCFGSPCQDLSVAGNRAGIKHKTNGDEETTRSGMFMEAIRVISEMREATNGRYPKFCLWENVPGALNSNKGEDFRIVLGELIKIVEPNAVMPPVPKAGWPFADSYRGDGWSLAYRLFDAQHWGVPQRRRRLHLVVDFTGGRAREVLFEREGVRGYFTQGRTPWQVATSPAQGSPDSSDCTGAGAGRGLDDVVPYTLKVRTGCAVDSAGKAAGKGALIQRDKAMTLAVTQDQYLFQPVVETNASGFPLGFRPENTRVYDEVATTLCNGTRPGFTCGVITSTPYCEVYDARGNGDGNTANTITGDHNNRITGDHNNRITDYTSVVAYALQSFGDYKDCGVASGLKARDYKDATDLVVEPVGVLASSAENAEITDGTITPCLMARAGTGENQLPLLALKDSAARVYYTVRRITPTECARLQGFADEWGDIDKKDDFTDEEYLFWHDVRNTHAAINGKQVKEYTKTQMLNWYNKLRTDSSEYKMWGNGIALPPALYCMQGIADALAREEEDDWLM